VIEDKREIQAACWVGKLFMPMTVISITLYLGIPYIDILVVCPPLKITGIVQTHQEGRAGKNRADTTIQSSSYGYIGVEGYHGFS
jgi:hypothetical protein